MLRRVLYIDLNKGESFVEDRYDLFEEWLGGTGVATQLLLEECPAGIDPLSPEAPIIFSIGPLNALFPAMTKTVATFKSPLSGELGESYAGGRLAMAMRFAGHESIVIRGAADRPVYISIRDDDVQIKDARSIWGIPATVVGYILRDVETGVGRRSIIRIGPGGEMLVKYAGVVVDTYRHFGRLGLGAAFGSKKLKAIVISGTEDVEVPDPRRYREIYKGLYKTVVQTDAMEKYHDIGTPININVLNQLKGLPTRNFQESSFEGAEKISGEVLADDYLFRRVSCAHCPIGCIHIGMLKTSFSREHEYEIRKISYDFELIYALGSNLGVSSPEGVLELIEACERQGIDAISTGVVLAWATEALERGIITPEDALGVKLQWNDVNEYLKAIDNIVKKQNEFYSALAEGVEAASEKYGGGDFAMALGKNEVPGYHTGPASIFGLTVGVRHSHLDNAGYSIDQKAAKKNLSPEEMVDAIIKEDDSRGVYNSLVGCLFARGVYSTEKIIEALASVGIERTEEELEVLGRKIFDEKYRFKRREGFDPERARIPHRFYETISTMGMVDPETIETMMKIYRRRRGW
ncbi:MAG: aldehyde ferredoxin oxidoreductase family protein [Methanothrix sp.]|jgi:aldehyde:ferredoxin oxidoreductase|uniref:Aldehyde ferredoxin oxidoreductase n=1 Tax=Methanothrix harundinacea TaxID=301375 RepID=A0A101ILH4_9EURY|nr:MAG: Aldehyde ferredoxin oxidoreductase [Methanothrix harundinacea]MDD2638809.1 aldehyde ferredoxin oxidoreductase family protein [Methanothrix sp.]MDI9398554.1 aldehyde ferredoxin oxidoreductase family protein [Euryarchaeota archaeon]MCP1391616.1 aldehyde ferredoxin oxidoreductase family protein [Methanothrix harundinacea]MDD3710950.1 aldehyde ferredoxin oxidoreductase family protein [Methanothrix sp.]